MLDKDELRSIKNKTECQWYVADTIDSDIPGVQYLSYEVWTVWGMARVEVYTPSDGAIIVGGVVHHMTPTYEMSEEYRHRGLKSIFDVEEERA